MYMTLDMQPLPRATEAKRDEAFRMRGAIPYPPNIDTAWRLMRTGRVSKHPTSTTCPRKPLGRFAVTRIQIPRIRRPSPHTLTGATCGHCGMKAAPESPLGPSLSCAKLGNVTPETSSCH